MEKNTCEIQAEEFAKKFGLTIKTDYLGHYVWDENIHYKVSQWEVTLQRTGKGSFSVIFSQSLSESWEYSVENGGVFSEVYSGIDPLLPQDEWEKLADGETLYSCVYHKVIQAPSIYDVLSCITKNNPGSFDEFCEEFGYNNDSIEDFSLYRRVCEEWAKVKGMFSDCMEELQNSLT